MLASSRRNSAMRSCSVMMVASFVVIYHYDDIWHKLHGSVQQNKKCPIRTQEGEVDYVLQQMWEARPG